MRFIIWCIGGLFFSCGSLSAQEQSKIFFSQLENGLANEWVSSITQDSFGFIWVGTQDGLHRYDGYSFNILRNSPNNTQSLAANWVRGIAIDSEANYWLGTNGGGVTKLLPEKMDFVNFSETSKNDIIGRYIYHIENVGENYVISCSEEGFSIFDIHSDSYEDIGLGELDAPMAYNDGMVWLAEKGNQLFTYNIATKTSEHRYTFNSNIELLHFIPEKGLLVGLEKQLVLFSGDSIEKEIIIDETLTEITYDGNANYFIASSSKISKFNVERFEIETIQSNLDLSDYFIETLFVDQQGSLWVGTDKGLFKERKYSKAFLPKNLGLHARRILKHREKLYVAGEKGLFSINDRIRKQLVENESVSGLINNADTIIASTDESNVYKFIGDSLIKKIVVSETPGKILGLAVDGGQRLWIGAWNGIYVFDRNDRFLKFISLNTESKVGEAKITNLYVDNNDFLWITTSAYGIFKINNASKWNLQDVSDKIVKYTRKTEDKNSLTNNIIMSYMEDNEGQLWFGSDIGVMKYERSSDDFSRLQYQGELFDKKIMMITNDHEDNIWITTISDGIYIYNGKEKTMRHFTQKDGLISDAFLFGSGYYDVLNKTMYFGTDQGVQEIDISRPFAENKYYTPIFTDFETNLIEGDSLISPFKVPFLNKISLKPYQNDFSISFSALDFTNPEKVEYAYALDDDAFKIADLQTAYFTNVPFGRHQLKVQTLYDGIIQDENISSFDIIISPPWYFSSIAKLIYILLVLGLLIGIYMYFKWRWRMQLNLRLKEEEAERLQKLNDFKSGLYTDIAHEFKTPLTLISGPIDQKLSQGNLSDFDHANFSIVKRNTHRLTSLVDQLLELAKLEDGKLKLHIRKGGLSLFLHTISQSFEYQAYIKDIDYYVEIENLEEVWYDEDILEKISTNLLSNAFKYTPKEGVCNFSVKRCGQLARISVKNKVAYASELDLDKLFTRFYQQDQYSEGMGVGLSLVQELVKFYGGTIKVEMTEKDVIHFEVTLPMNRSDFPEAAIEQASKNTDPMVSKFDIIDVDYSFSSGAQEERPILLIVEDHKEVRQFIKLALQKKYRILEAENGKTGLEIALSQIPDIVLSDIRMPIKNGIQLCNMLKSDERTSHIPIILLTASVGEEDELKGLTSGADDFVRKPFKINVLKQRIANLVAIRRLLRDRYSQELILKPKDISITPGDEVFLDKIQRILDENLSDPEFNSEAFSKKAKMSRMQLHRKLLAYTGLSTSAFIRSQRLKQAVQILKTSDLTINEVAYTVGFNTPTYFMKCFKETFKKTPSEYMQNIEKQ